MFLQALQFQQQQAAQNQAASYATQYGNAPAGNYMTWGAGGPTQPDPGTATLGALAQMFGMGTSAAGLTGQYNSPNNWQYQPGQYVYNSQSGQIGQIQGGGQLLVLPSVPQGVNVNSIPNVDSYNFGLLQQGQGTPSQTQQATAQAYQNAATQAAQTGVYNQPMGNIAQDAFNNAGPQTQQTYLNQYQGDSSEAAQHYWQDVQGAIQASGQTPQQFVYGTSGPTPTTTTQQLYGQFGMPTQGQQTLQAQNQAATLSGLYNGAPTETAREFNQSQGQQYQEFLQNLGLQQGQLGQQYLATAAQLQGPQNTFQLSNYLRGAQGNPNVPVYLNSLGSNIGMPSFQATGSTTPTPASMGGFASAMTGNGTGSGANANSGQAGALSGWNYNDTLNSIQGIAQRGAQGLAPGSLEQLSPDELQAFGSGLGATGYSLPSFMAQYAASRVGQNAPIGQTGVSY